MWKRQRFAELFLSLRLRAGAVSGIAVAAVAAAAVGGVAATAAGCSGVLRLDRSGIPTMTVAELKAGRGDPKRFTRGFAGRGVVVRVRRGEELPLRITSTLGIATLRAGDNRLRFDRDLWLYLARRRSLISPDGRRWVPFADWSRIKRLFGIRKGTVQVGFGVNQVHGAFVNLEVRTQMDR